jgi:hypothetical protein
MSGKSFFRIRAKGEKAAKAMMGSAMQRNP